MRSRFSFVFGFVLAAVLFGGLALFAQDNPLNLLRPIVIDIQQSVPVVADVALPTDDGVITATLPLTVDVALQVQIAGLSAVTVTGGAAPIVKVPVAGESQVDDLGIEYTMSIDDDDLEITEWTAYIDSDGQFEISAVSHLRPGAQPIEDVFAAIRVYDAEDKVIDIQEILNVAYRLEPGTYSRFPVHTFADPEQIDHYTVEFKVIR